jgi:HK97 family phage prohead protease
MKMLAEQDYLEIADDGDYQRKEISALIAPGSKPRTYRFLASDGGYDRDGDRVQGWDTSTYQKNPVVLAHHDTKQVVATSQVSETYTPNGRALMADIVFPQPGVSERADEVRRQVEAGLLRAVSIGFRSLGRRTPNEKGGVDFERVELVEISLVAVPANPRALLDSVKALSLMDGNADSGIDIIEDGDGETFDVDEGDLKEALKKAWQEHRQERGEVLDLGDLTAADVRSAIVSATGEMLGQRRMTRTGSLPD